MTAFRSLAELSFDPIDDRLPPHSVELEEAVLGGILLDPCAIDRVIGILKPESFYLVAHQHIYRAAIALHVKSQPITLISVLIWLKDNHQLENAGGQARLGQLLDRVMTAVNIDEYAKLLADKHLRRELIRHGREQIKKAYDTEQDIKPLLESSEQSLYALSHDLNRSLVASHVEDIGLEVIRDLERGVSPGLKTDFYDLDALMGGFNPGALITTAAATGLGKTHFAVAASYAIAKKHNMPVVFITCEMSKEELTTRFLARISGIDSQKLDDCALEPDEWGALLDAYNELASLPIYIYEASSPNPAEMRSIVRRVQADRGLGLIVLDYLQLLGEGNENRVRELDVITKACKGMAMDFHVPFLALAQINRAVATRAEKRPTLADLRESGAIENHSNQVLFLYRDEYYNPNTVDRGIIELHLAKNRRGKSGTVKMLFDPRLSLFKNLQRRES